MVRNYKRKNSDSFNEDDMTSAMEAVESKTMSLRVAAATFNVKHTALFYRIKKKNAQVQINRPQEIFSSKFSHQQVFTCSQEDELVAYLKRCAKLMYGLSLHDLREFAFEYATQLGRTFPPSWGINSEAGKDWSLGFLKRHKTLSLRKPENTSLARATAFNKANVEDFQNKLMIVLEKEKFPASRIFNLDETGVATVTDSVKIIAASSEKQVGHIASSERGTLVSMCAIISAAGNRLPPVFIFPRARYSDLFIKGGPEDCIGLVNNPVTGWMTKKSFLKVLEHIKIQTNCSPEGKILIILDNHESHCSIEAIEYAKANGIELFTLPPHTSHRLQPLDVSVMGPFKAKLKIAQHDFLIKLGCSSSKKRGIIMQDIASICKTAIDASFTVANIMSGFKATGICPFNRNVFDDSDFVSATAPTESTSIAASLEVTSEEPLELEAPLAVTPESFRPIPSSSVQPSENKTGRKKGSSQHLTSTPVKQRLEEERKAKENKQKENERKKKEREEKKKIREEKKIEQQEKKKEREEKKRKVDITCKARKKLRLSSSDEDNDDVALMSLASSDEYDSDMDRRSLDDEEESADETSAKEKESLQIGDFVLVNLTTKKTSKFYIAKIVGVNPYEVVYMVKKGKAFKSPPIEIVYSLEEEEIVRKVRQVEKNGTARTAGLYNFQKINNYVFD